ncbi:MAG: type II toxin-antitoxin system VapC family toxin [Blastochloris sp.]|nr:type II toxin-antitoxin system VapC family toxin [Blastochloris sp.]
MSYLIDTNAWIGFWGGDQAFGSKAKQIMVDQPDTCLISMASIWEASIKIGLGKLRLPYDLRRDLPRLLEENGFLLLGIEQDDALGVLDLPPHHGDTFDRMMTVQAMRRNLRVISRDPVFERYGLRRVW